MKLFKSFRKTLNILDFIVSRRRHALVSQIHKGRCDLRRWVSGDVDVGPVVGEYLGQTYWLVTVMSQKTGEENEPGFVLFNKGDDGW